MWFAMAFVVELQKNARLQKAASWAVEHHNSEVPHEVSWLTSKMTVVEGPELLFESVLELRTVLLETLCVD
jgi:hypothetical protein